MIRSGRASGLLAYCDGKVVGWCNAGPRMACRNLQHIAKTIQDPAESIGSIRCFVAAPAYRNKGVASALLRAACDMFARDGLAIAEGYPKTVISPTPEGVPTTALNYHGPLAMYLKEGFTVHREVDGLTLVRKSLR
jgi:GNAT superfamily N-acetyltransferase